MNKKDFVKEVSSRTMVTPYVVEDIFNVSSGVIIEWLSKGEKVEVPHLGTFILRQRKPTVYKNLYGTDKEKKVEAIIYPTFQVVNNIKNRVKNSLLNKKVTKKLPF